MKAEIIETSLKQFIKYGIRDVSIQKLVEPLGISTKTVYKYFKSKEELLEETLLLYHNKQHKLLENLSGGQNAARQFFDLWKMAIDMGGNAYRIFFQDLNYYYPALGEKNRADHHQKI